MRQRGLTVITPIKEERVEELRTLLNGIDSDIPGNEWVEFSKLSLVHMMRWVILPAEVVQGEQIPPQLCMSTNYDGKPLLHLEEMVARAEKGMRAIYEHCSGCPKLKNRKSMVEYLYQHRVKTTAFYSGVAGRTVQQIKREAWLMSEIQDHFESHIPQHERVGKSPQECQIMATERFFAMPGMQWIYERAKPPFINRYGDAIVIGSVLLALGAYAALWIWLPLVALILTAIGVLGVGTIYTSIRLKENREAKAYRPTRRDGDKIQNLGMQENYPVQNQITHLVAVKPGYTRKVMLKFTLGAINFLAKYKYNKGNLNGINTIHFARWVLIDNGKRLLFFSNYDGSWESYLGEFVDRGFIGLTSVWTHTEDFPPTKNLVQGGARRSREFKAWSREKQIPTQVWYSAYHLLSLKNVLRNTAIRQKLIRSLDEGKFQEFLDKV